MYIGAEKYWYVPPYPVPTASRGDKDLTDEYRVTYHCGSNCTGGNAVKQARSGMKSSRTAFFFSSCQCTPPGLHALSLPGELISSANELFIPLGDLVLDVQVTHCHQDVDLLLCERLKVGLNAILQPFHWFLYCWNSICMSYRWLQKGGQCLTNCLDHGNDQS